MLRLNAVEKRYGDVIALRGIDLTVERGEIVGFLGPNGSGKTTTMRSVMGLVAIDGGDITWDGAPIDLAKRARFGYMPAERGLYPKMSVRDQIVYFGRLAGLDRSAAGSAAATWMERLELTERADDEVQSLSSGNQQRVQLAVTLVHGPELLILDEPFAGLDPIAVETMKAILVEQTASGVAVLFSSHQLDLVADLCRRVVMVAEGRVALAGSVDVLEDRAPYRVAEVTFAEPTTWLPSAPSAVVVDRSERTVRVRVTTEVAAASLLSDAESTGAVASYSFGPPDLSELFVATVGAGRRGCTDEDPSAR